MKRSLVIPVIMICVFLVVPGAIALLLMERFEVSFPTLINKVANKLSIGEQDALFITPQARYADTSLVGIRAATYPRILAHELQGWEGRTPAPFLSKRLQIINDKRLGFRINCNNKHLASRLNCFASKPSEQSFNRLLDSLTTFRVVKPKVSNSRGNAWLFSFALDIAKSSHWLSDSEWQQLDAMAQAMLLDYLQLLDNDSASLWHSRASLGAQAFLIATVLNRENETNKQLYRRALGHFQQTYHAIVMTETWPGGYNYWINNRAFISVLAMSAYANAQIQSHDKADIIASIKRIGLAHIHFTRPDFKMSGWADEGPRIDLKDETARVIDLIAQLTKEPVFFHFAQSIRQRYGAESYYSGYRWLLPWLYSPEYHEPTSVRAKRSKTDLLWPMAPYLNNNMLFGHKLRNHLAVRSGWGTDDTVISYQAGHIFTHHQHYNAGHFTLFKGAPLLVDAAQYNGSVLSPRRRHIDIRTLSKNSLLIEQPDEVVKPNHLFKQNVAAGGQRLAMPTGSAITSVAHWQAQRNGGMHLGAAELIRYFNAPENYVAISSDLTSAYNSTRFSAGGNNAKVKQVIRHLAYLNQYDVMFTYDKILSTDANYRTKWLAHTVNKPRARSMRQLKGTVNDGIASTMTQSLRTTNGKGQLSIDILAPQLTTTAVVGGERYQHYVEADGDSNELNGQFFEQGYKVKPWYDKSPWRIEISPVDQQQLTRYVVAMQRRLTIDKDAAYQRSPLSDSKGGASHLGPLLVLWPHSKPIWQATLSGDSEEMVLFLDKPAQLKLEVKGQPQVQVIQGQVGVNLVAAKFSKGAQIRVSSAR